MKYTALLTFIGAPIVNVIFRGNNIFDPDQTGVGQQPYGFDQMAALYKSYRVLGSELSVTFNSSAGSNNTRCCLIPTSTEPFAPLGIENVLFNKRARATHVGANDGGSAQRKLKAYYSTAAIFGVNKSIVKVADDYEALVTGAPLKEWDWHIFTEHCDGITQVAMCADIELTYYVKWSNPFTQELS